MLYILLSLHIDTYTDIPRADIVQNTVQIDFEAVARECGYSNTRSASNRLAAIKKTGTSAGTSTSASVSPTTVTSGSNDKVTKRKSARQKSSSSKASRKTAEKGTESMDSGGGKIGREQGDLEEQKGEQEKPKDTEGKGNGEQ